MLWTGSIQPPKAPLNLKSSYAHDSSSLHNIIMKLSMWSLHLLTSSACIRIVLKPNFLQKFWDFQSAKYFFWTLDFSCFLQNRLLGGKYLDQTFFNFQLFFYRHICHRQLKTISCKLLDAQNTKHKTQNTKLKLLYIYDK